MKDKIYQQIEFAQRQAENAPSQEEYFKWVGYIQGLRFVLGLPSSEKSEKSWEEEEQGQGDQSFKSFDNAVKQGEI